MAHNETILGVSVANPQKTAAGHVEYDIAVSWGEGSVSGTYTVCARYSKFMELDAALRARFGALPSLPALPPAQWLGSNDADFLAHRCEGLDSFLRAAVVAGERLTSSAELRAFLQFQKRAALTTGGGAPSSPPPLAAPEFASPPPLAPPPALAAAGVTIRQPEFGSNGVVAAPPPPPPPAAGSCCAPACAIA